MKPDQDFKGLFDGPSDPYSMDFNEFLWKIKFEYAMTDPKANMKMAMITSDVVTSPKPRAPFQLSLEEYEQQS
jgi:hypothetical protein